MGMGLAWWQAALWSGATARKFGRSVRQRSVAIGQRLQQKPRVGVQRVAEYRLARAEFDDAAEIHDGNAVGDVADDGKVVRDEKIGQATCLL